MRSYLSQDLSLPRPCVEGICLYVQGRTLKSCKDEYEDICWAFNQGRPIQPLPPYSAPSKSVEKTFKEFGTLFPALQLPIFNNDYLSTMFHPWLDQKTFALALLHLNH